jgi:hypothetical protein
MEVEVEEVEAYEEVTPVVEVSDEFPERAQDAGFVEVEAPCRAVSPEHAPRYDFAVALDDNANAEDSAELRFES